MDTYDLKRFLTLANNLKFNQTASKCSVSQSALSRTITRLEDELGVRLFNRNNHSVSLTEAGKIFKEYAENYLNNFNEIKQKLKNLNHPLSGKIRLYCSVTASLFLLPQLLNKFRNLFPQIEIKIETGDAAIALEKLVNDDVDLSIAALPKHLSKELTTIELAKIPLIFIAPCQIPTSWYENNKLSWKNIPYVLSEQGELRHAINSWFVKHKILNPKIYAEVAGHEAIVSMVALGLGVALIPQAVIEQSLLSNSVQTILVPDDIEPFNVSLCIKPQSLKKEHIKAFVNLIENTID